MTVKSFRIGRRVPRNVYEGDEPIFMAATPELAARLVALLNRGQKIMGKEQIARVCHEVNRAYCQALGDNSQPPWEQAPDWQKDSAMMGVELHTANNVGPEASHESWMKKKLDEGWSYGAYKDPENRKHPCIMPFDELSQEQQAKDYIFRAVVHALRELSPVE